jgi:hypothetical protein
MPNGWLNELTNWLDGNKPNGWPNELTNWLYSIPTIAFAGLIVGATLAVALLGLLLARRFLLPHFKYHEGVNDAVSGAVQAIGVFYGITVGLIAIEVWDNYSNARDITSREAATVATLYINTRLFRDPQKTELRDHVRNYLTTIIEKVWPAQKRGEISSANTPNWEQLRGIRELLMEFDPEGERQKVQYAAMLGVFNQLVEQRRLRIDATAARLSSLMWCVIVIGAVISIGVVYLFNIADAKIHGWIVGLIAGFLGIVLFMIAINDRPFLGVSAIEPDTYKAVLEVISMRLLDYPLY